jgi:hypothetical protein
MGRPKRGLILIGDIYTLSQGSNTTNDLVNWAITNKLVLEKTL